MSTGLPRFGSSGGWRALETVQRLPRRRDTDRVRYRGPGGALVDRLRVRRDGQTTFLCLRKRLEEASS